MKREDAKDLTLPILAEDTQLDNKQFAIKMLPAILVSNKRANRDNAAAMGITLEK